MGLFRPESLTSVLAGEAGCGKKQVGRSRSACYVSIDKVSTVVEAVVLAAISLVIQLPPGNPVAQGIARRRMVYCKCVQCGYVVEGAAGELVEKGVLDPVERSTLTESGRRCSECDRNSPDITFKCPKDGTVFLFGRQAGQSYGCPKCGSNPYSR